MIKIKENVALKHLNTFGIVVFSKLFVEIDKVDEIHEFLHLHEYMNFKKLILGGGSNILFMNNFNGIIIKNNLKGFTIENETEEEVYVRAAAGENWHEFVLWTISKNYGGLENLSLIPGCVGASPMQNIGAYGVEIKDCFHSLEAINLINGEHKTFTPKECEFGYRDSVFKRELKDRYIIVSVTYRLSKKPIVNTSYGAIQDELNKMGIESPSIQDVSNAVISIRSSKLPDPKNIGNAGSFFKNPEVSSQFFKELKEVFPEIVAYELKGGNYKIAAGWLIENAGLKGISRGNAGVHDKQALVLINKGGATGQEIYELSEHVVETVYAKFEIELEREVNII